MGRAFQQLDDQTLALLKRKVEEAGSVKIAATALGVARTSVSQALNRNYPADTHRLAAKIWEAFGALTCPHLKQEITPAHCKQMREAALSGHSRAEVAQWGACRYCAQNPNRKTMDDAA